MNVVTFEKKGLEPGAVIPRGDRTLPGMRGDEGGRPRELVSNHESDPNCFV